MDGRLFRLAGCAGGNESQCGQEKQVLQASVGKGAAKYLAFGKGGSVTLRGISAKAFGVRFGTVAGGLGRLIANGAATFTLDLGNAKMANTTDMGLSSGGGRFHSLSSTIFVDPSKFPLSKGGIRIDTTEAVVHEMGHALATLYQGLSAGIDAAANPRGSLLSVGEGYAMSFENHYRREVLGVGDRDIRAFYGSYGDYVDPGQISLFPQ